MKNILLTTLLFGLYALLPTLSSAGERYSVGFNSEFYTGYQWRNHVSTDEAAFHGCLWGDVTIWESVYVGGYIWQNYDLTDNRRYKFHTAFTETDYGIHLGGTPWDNESERFPMKLSLEGGHEWYVYNDRVFTHHDYPCTDELYLLGTLTNPIVDVYGKVSWMYRDFGAYKSGFHYEVGLNKEIALPKVECVKVGADWNVSMDNKPYHVYLFGPATSGLSGTTLRLYAKYSLTDWAIIKATLAYTGVLGSENRSALKPGDYDRDMLWGCLALNLAF